MPLTPWSVQLSDQICGTIILGEPVPKGRPQFNRKTGSAYTPAVTRKAEARIRERLERVRPIRPYSLPLVMWLTFWCSSSRPGDWENLAKLALDAGNNLIYEDDSQIVEAHVRVYKRATQARTEWVATCLPR
jgi:Holliday junction resolvase RusA-like endonuclease